MSAAGRQHDSTPTPVPLLFLIADTGGGHRSAARAVSQALDRLYPGQFAPVLCDPLGGPAAGRALRWITGLYGPVTRLVPCLWGAAYYAVNSVSAMRLLHRVLLHRADRPAADAARAGRPAAVVSFHPLAGRAAVAARAQAAPGAAAVTVITDLAIPHAAWLSADADLIVGAAAGAQQPGHGRAPRLISGGPPVTRDFWGGPVSQPERLVLRRSLGLPQHQPGKRDLLIMLTGGGEGSGGIARKAVMILRSFEDVSVVAVCGHNRRLRRRLDRLAAGWSGRLIVTGFSSQMADLMRCADLVVTKAGPGTIAEAACCGAPLLLTSQLPGQEHGNAEIVTRAGAGRRVRGLGQLRAQIAALACDPAAIEAMRTAAACLARPGDAARIAELIAGLTGIGSPPVPVHRRRADAGERLAAR